MSQRLKYITISNTEADRGHTHANAYSVLIQNYFTSYFIFPMVTDDG